MSLLSPYPYWFDPVSIYSFGLLLAALHFKTPTGFDWSQSEG
jgi:hypothetical protein